jgi:coenzyme F420-reducing hydrogenase delta subunit
VAHTEKKRKSTKSGGASKTAVFTCNWYPAIAADNAGVLGHRYVEDCRIITLTCAGHIMPATILDAFGSGAQGVLVAACKPELCHYVNGSSSCETAVDETRRLAELLGIGAERIGLEFFDSEDSERFARCVNEFHEKIARLKAMVIDTGLGSGE